MKKILFAVIILLMCLMICPVQTAYAKNSTKKAASQTNTKKKKKKKKEKKTTEKKKSTKKTTERQTPITEDVPVSDVIVDDNNPAPDMSHKKYDANPASAFTDVFTSFLTKYKGVVLGVAGVVDILLIGVVIFRLTQLGAVGANNPQGRRNALTALFISLLAVAIMGSVTLWYGLFFSALR